MDTRESNGFSSTTYSWDDNTNPHSNTARWMFHKDETTRELRKHFRKLFYWFHVLCAIFLLVTLIVIIVYGANGTFNAQIYWTYSPLERDTTPSPPKAFFTNFRIIHTAHLAVACAFIPFFAMLYYLSLILPSPLSLFLMSCCGMGRRARNYEKAGKLDPDDDSYEHFSKVYLAWFDRNLLTGHAGFKFTFYAFSMAFITVVVAHAVGITDFFALFMLWVYPFFGFLILWHYEYSTGTLIANAHDAAKRGKSIMESFLNPLPEPQEDPYGLVPSQSSTMQTESSTPIGFAGDAMKTADDKIQDFVDFLGRTGVGYTPVFVAKMMILIPFAEIITYFAEMVSEDSGAVGSEVYVVVIYYIFMIITILLVFWLHNIHFIILRNIFIAEFIIQTTVVAGCILIPLVFLGSTRNEGIVYGIALVP